VSLVNTAQGTVNTTDIGVTLMHEHVFIMTTEIALNYPEAWGDEDKRVADAIARLNELKSRGVDTIVDLTVIGLGRYIPRIARVAAETASSPPACTPTTTSRSGSTTWDPAVNSADRRS
jgi:phosphotriesterase-related protein